MYVHLGKAFSFGQLQQTVQMGDMAVDAAVGKQPHKVDGRIILLGILHRLKQRFVFEKVAVLDLLGDSGQLLIYDASCAHVQMTHLRVSHLAVGQPHRQPAGISLHKGTLAHQLIHHRRLSLADCVCLTFII